MHMNQAASNLEMTVPVREQSFSSVWGNEMRREDFLALAAGLRQFNAYPSDTAASPVDATEYAQYAVE